jgi:ribosome assembly protein YihI (activator of Der GTPase)
MKAFEHGLTSDNLEGLYAYMRCLKALYDHLEAETNFRPENKHVDAIVLLDRISATFAELKILIDEAAAKQQAKDKIILP